jgi:hypothetical protein
MLADPLRAEVVGKPDHNAVATNVSRFRDVYDITTDANGQAVMLFMASPMLGDFPAPTITAGAVTAAGNPVSSQYNASLTADNEGVRILCYVVEWQPTLSDLNASGKVFLGQYNGSHPLQALQAYFDDEGLASTAKERAVVVNRPLHDLLFHTPNARSPEGSLSSPHANVVMVLSGMPKAAQVVGQVVVTRIVELIPKGTTLARSTASHSICDMNDCCTAANIIGSGATFGRGEDAYEKTARYAWNIVQKAARMYQAYSTSGVSELARVIAR